MPTAPISCPSIDTRCEDPEFAADNPTICPDAPTITGLRVSPSSGEVEVNSDYPFAAYLTFSDGREKNVTTVAAWSSNNGNIADVVAGVCTGKAVGVVTIEATYRGLFDFGQLTVVSQCFQVGMDIVLVCDRSASMLTKNAAGETRITNLKVAAKALVANCIFTKDQVSIISFAGIYETSAAGIQTKHADSTVHLVLSPSEPDVLAAIDAINVNEPCLYELADGGQGSRCATSIGGGLQAAKDELQSSRSRAGVRKMVILLTDGLENICSPSPVVVADEIKALNWVIVVVAFDVPDTISHVCGSTQVAWTYLSSLSACNLFFPAADAGALTDIFSRIPSIICKNQGDPCFYFFAPPTSNPPAPGRTRDQYDYRGFANWDVVKGTVDLIGVELWPGLSGGHGLIVDLVGTGLNLQTGTATSGNHDGTIRSKTLFSLSAQRYRLTVSLAGNGRVPSLTDKVVIVFGSMLNTILSLKGSDPLKSYTFDLSPSSAGVGFIEIGGVSGAGGGTIGPLLFDVKLENLDTGEVLLEDGFDDENPT